MAKNNTSFVKNLLYGLFSSKPFKVIIKTASIVIIILLFIYYYWEFTWILSKNQESRISILLYMTYVTLNIMLIIVCFTHIFIGHKNYTSFAKNIAYVDKLSKNLELRYKESVNIYISFKQILLVIVTTASYVLFYYRALTENDFPLFDFTEIICIPLVWLLIFQINVKLNQILRRFNYIKNILEAYMAKSMNIYWIHWNNVGPKEITVLNRMHLFTYISFTDVCSYYSIQLLVLIPRVIFINVLPVHYNIVTALIADDGTTSHKWSQIFTMSVIILTIWPVIHLVKCASNTIEKVRKIISNEKYLHNTFLILSYKQNVYLNYIEFKFKIFIHIFIYYL